MKFSSNNFAIFDVETSLLKDGEIPKTKFWGYYDGEKYRRFETSGQLAGFLKKQSQKIILHHFNFDVIQLLVDRQQVFPRRSHECKLIRCSFFHHTTQNTAAAFPPMALEKFFKAFGYKKTSLKHLAKRNYDDCVKGLECFLKLDTIFKELTGFSPLIKGTIAGTAFAGAEKAAGKMPKDLRFLEAYRGGRADLFDLRRTKCSKLDICSSYPKSFVDAPQKGTLLHLRVTTADFYCPFFDANNEEKLIFPNGTFSTWMYQDVFERYVEPYMEKTKVKILSRHKIDLSWIFSLAGYVQRIYKRKLEAKQSGNLGLELACKILLNSMYGRIGLRGESEKVSILNHEPDGDDITYEYIGGKRWIVFEKILREPRSNFAFAAYITDNARGRLFQAFKQNGAIYGDTDSVFTPSKKSEFVGKIGVHLGEFNYEKRDWFLGLNVKDYKFGKEIVRKGGVDSVTWTLKQFAKGKFAESVHRTRQTSLLKRRVFPDGTTAPLIVGK